MQWGDRKLPTHCLKFRGLTLLLIHRFSSIRELATDATFARRTTATVRPTRRGREEWALAAWSPGISPGVAWDQSHVWHFESTRGKQSDADLVLTQAVKVTVRSSLTSVWFHGFLREGFPDFEIFRCFFVSFKAPGETSLFFNQVNRTLDQLFLLHQRFMALKVRGVLKLDIKAFCFLNIQLNSCCNRPSSIRSIVAWVNQTDRRSAASRTTAVLRSQNRSGSAGDSHYLALGLQICWNQENIWTAVAVSVE